MASFQNIATLVKKYYKANYVISATEHKLIPDFHKVKWNHYAEISNLHIKHIQTHKAIKTEDEKEYLQIKSTIAHGFRLEGCKENIAVTLHIPQEIRTSLPGLPWSVNIPIDFDHTHVIDTRAVKPIDVSKEGVNRLNITTTAYISELRVRTIFSGNVVIYKNAEDQRLRRNGVEFDMERVISSFSEQSNQCSLDGHFITMGTCMFTIHQPKA